jgi:DNA modification methylase
MTLPINEIICGDCLDVMSGFPDECIDLTVTSPPYDNLRKYQGYTFDFEGIAHELYRITKPGGVVVWVVGDATVNGSETGTSFRQALFFKEIGFNLHDTMIYAKNNAMPLTHNRYDPCFEYMFVLSKKKPKTFNPLLDESKYRGQVKKRFLETKSNIDIKSCSRKRNEKTIVKKTKYKKNIWCYAVGIESEIETGNHPAIFPEQLAYDHIISWSNPGDLVFDPMVGSGTTCKMASLNNRNYIGIDISEEYCEIARERIKTHTAQLRLNMLV